MKNTSLMEFSLFSILLDDKVLTGVPFKESFKKDGKSFRTYSSRNFINFSLTRVNNLFDNRTIVSPARTRLPFLRNIKIVIPPVYTTWGLVRQQMATRDFFGVLLVSDSSSQLLRCLQVPLKTVLR